MESKLYLDTINESLVLTFLLKSDMNGCIFIIKSDSLENLIDT